MEDSKQTIIESSICTAFTLINKCDLEKTKAEGRLVAVSGKVCTPGIYEVPEGTTLNELIQMAGGISEKQQFKAAQLGVPFGGFLTSDDLDSEIDFSIFRKNTYKGVVILSSEDCIIQFAIYYLDYVLSMMRNGEYLDLIACKNDIERMSRIFDRISKGKATTRDVYLLRYIASNVKERVGQEHNFVLDIIEDFYEEIEHHIEYGECPTGTCPQLAQLRITDKCVGCGACKRACPIDCIEGEVKTKHYINYNKCTHCGACLQACPLSAITEGDNTLKFLRDLSVPDKIVVTQMAPAVRVALGEAFGFEPGVNVEKKINAALRRLGVSYVFDTTWAADLTIMEEASELQERLEAFLAGDKNVKLPLLTSCCPAWVKFIEQSYPDMLDVPSTAKSPMEMFSTVVKDIWAKEHGYKRSQVVVVGIMPCVAKKYEASREEFSRGDNYDTDYVITTNELIEILKKCEIDLNELPDEEFDAPLGEYSGAGVIFGRTGGVIEAATRTAVEKMTGERLEKIEFEELRGYEGFRSCELNVNGIQLKIGVAHGLKEAKVMLDKIRSGEEFYHAIEIMACTGGCIGGGGQPKVKIVKNKPIVLEQRGNGLNTIDENAQIRRSHENPAVLAIYEKYLDAPLSRKAHELLHTKYFPKLRK